MNARLLVNEVAKLLNLSAHTIRYYDKEGLISPAVDPATGYRYFDSDDVTKLLNIVILRDGGIAIKDIKSLVDDYSTTKYQQLLEQSQQQLDKDIERLMQQRTVVANTLQILDDQTAYFTVSTRPCRHLRHIYNSGYDAPISAREIYDIHGRNQIDNLAYLSLFYELNDDDMALYIEDDAASDLVLQAADYAEYNFVATSDDDVLPAVEILYNHITEHGLTCDPRIFMLITPHSMLVTNHGYRAQIFAEIIK